MPFLFVSEDNKNQNKGEGLPRQGGVNWKPVMVFYAKTTSWVILPLAVALVLAKVVNVSQTSFFIFIMIGFGITCSGIYKQIKEYKKTL